MLGTPDVDAVIKALIKLRDTCKGAKIEVVEIKGVGASGAGHHDAKTDHVEIDVRLLIPVSKG